MQRIVLGSVFVGSQSYNCFEVSVKASQRCKTAIKGYVKNLFLRFFQQIRCLVYAVLIDVIGKGNSRALLEVAGQIDLVIGNLIGKGAQIALFCVVFLNKFKNFSQKIFSAAFLLFIFRGIVKFGTDRV